MSESAIARALAMQPEILICDEATSALDVTVQRQIVELLTQLRKEQKMACLFICHDLLWYRISVIGYWLCMKGKSWKRGRRMR